MSDLTSQEVLCAWAKERYNLTEPVGQVDFDMDEGIDSGCDTCGHGNEPPSVEVIVRNKDGLRIHIGFEEYVPDLINSIVEVGLRGA